MLLFGSQSHRPQVSMFRGAGLPADPPVELPQCGEERRAGLKDSVWQSLAVWPLRGFMSVDLAVFFGVGTPSFVVNGKPTGTPPFGGSPN